MSIATTKHRPTIPIEPDEQLLVRLVRWIDASAGPEACWPWTGATMGDGYGTVWNGDKHVRAHRVAWAALVGPIPDGLFVLHRCDNRPCCNPRHLFLGTSADNARDMAAKGRQALQTNPELARGERNGRCVLTDADVADIRRRNAAGESQAALAQEFGIGSSHISRLIRRESRT